MPAAPAPSLVEGMPLGQAVFSLSSKGLILRAFVWQKSQELENKSLIPEGRSGSSIMLPITGSKL